MALLPSTHILLLPFIFVLTLPVALFASLTTFFAFSILFVRVTLVYIELALAIIPYYLLGPPSPSSNPEYDLLKASAYSPTTLATARRKKRRASSSSNLSGTGSITPISGESLLGLSQSIGITRDFEGVGGWRLDNNNSDDDGLWTNINSRLELPAEHGRRHHHRSLTSGSLPNEKRHGRSGSPEEQIMNTSRVRTPSLAMEINGEYFPAQKGIKRNGSTTTGISGNSGNSGSSKGSSVVLLKLR